MVASGTASSSQGQFSAGTADLASVPTGASAYFALLLTADTAGNAAVGWSGVLAFANSMGGDYSNDSCRNSWQLTGWDALDANIVLSPVPEPTTLALGALGGLSLLLFRRKQS